MRAFAFLFGIIFLMIGIGGFVPDFVAEERLIQVFRVNLALNLIHVAFGVFAFITGFISKSLSTLYLRITGIVFAGLAIMGFIFGDADLLGVIANNNPDTWFHVIMAVAALVIGFGSKD